MIGRDPYRQYRRYARRSFRRGAYPVLFMGTGEPLALIAITAVSRWLFRHRSAFAPPGIAAAEFIIASMIHPQHQQWAIAVLCSTAITALILGVPHRYLWAHPSLKFTAGILARAWEACGIDRPTERAYATTVIAIGGGWLTAAIATGPTVKPLPAIAVISTIVLGIPWWAHRRRRARVRAVRTIQAWPDLAENMRARVSRRL